MQIQDLSHFEDEKYDSGDRRYSDDSLVELVHQNCNFLLHVQQRAMRLESESEATRELMWQIALDYLSGKYSQLVTSDQVGSKQAFKRIILHNGTVLTICEPEATLGRAIARLFAKD